MFSCYAPKLYARCCDYFSWLCLHDCALAAHWNFENSIFPTTTVNFSPSTVCYGHLDSGNVAAGWCTITSARSYDPKCGGHLILFNVDLVIGFSPGATILIPLSIMRHGNTPFRMGKHMLA